MFAFDTFGRYTGVSGATVATTSDRTEATAIWQYGRSIRQ
jgi:hypothetical protein